MKCKNCGCGPDWIIGRDLEEKYKITVISIPRDDLMSLICQCGHHAKDHKHEGSGGICLKCCPFPVHNFCPADHTKRIRS